MWSGCVARRVVQQACKPGFGPPAQHLLASNLPQARRSAPPRRDLPQFVLKFALAVMDTAQLPAAGGPSGQATMAALAREDPARR